MDKKNTMLLTVIAVATLLVAVVGATFAYFTATAQNQGETINVTGSTTSVGAPTLSTPTTAMHINLTGTEMAQGAQGSEYFSAVDAQVPYLASATPVNIAKMTVDGGDATVTYTCDYELTIARGTTDTMIAGMAAGDGKLVLAGDTITGTKEHDLTTITAEGVKVAGQVTDLSTASEEFVTAYVQINNTENPQNFAGTNLAVEVKATTFNCVINKAA